jgi:hypothetical protein
VAVDRAANDNVGVVQLEKVAVLCLNLVGALVGPKLLDVRPGRVENRVEEQSMAQLEQLSGQHRRRVLLHCRLAASRSALTDLRPVTSVIVYFAMSSTTSC